ncbi:MAG: MurR/RpiR family transcriptional regulator [Streptococcaceae bacterium]|jgi:DNA-binding MurR/RpiR family transcriptional regulator|nr:MurR/RpiR family transcriptional regulator [Streptococcaceae bacterium]
MMNFKSRTINARYKLTELDRALISHIYSHKREVSETKITSLAKAFFTVPNTITRLCHKLGYDGFSDLKAELKHELSDTTPENLQAAMLLKNLGLIDKAREAKVVTAFRKARAVNFYAVSQTGLIAKICVDNFYALDDKFLFYTYPNKLLHRIEHADNEIFFFISLSGETESVVKLAEEARAQHQTVVSLTNLTENRLSALADISLFCYTKKESVENYDVTDKTPILIVMNSLFHTFLER